MAPLASRTTVPTVAVDRVLERADARIVDLRAPAEFAHDHLPGALNLPLFDDVQRAIIGTLYKRESPQAAFAEGARLARGRIAGLVAELARVADWSLPATDLEARLERVTAGGLAALEGELGGRPLADLPPQPVVLHCWRGGLRSRSVVHFVRELGLRRAVGLEGGYKAYRERVRRDLEGFDPPPTYVLRGWTGVGKTLVLRELERLRPGWTLDFEACAGHRSSLLGMVGLQPASQKLFESRLARRLRAGFSGRLVVEGESRKVGDAIIPPALWRALEGGVNLRLEAPLWRRIEVLRADYLACPGDRGLLRRQLAALEPRMGPRKYAGVLTGLLDQDRVSELVELLLERYYDPLYRHGERGREHVLLLDATDPAACAAAVAAWIETRRTA